MPKKSDYVRVLYDFVTNESGEIPLKKGDVVRVLSQVDANWLYGKLGVSVGNFPMNFVEEIVVPSIKYGEVLYVGTDDFISDTEGDLSFVKGDIIVGYKPFGNSWWKGSCEGREGLFPTTHVRRLDVEELPTTVLQTSQRNSIDESIKKPTSNTTIAKARAVMNLSAQLDDELGFNQGDVIEILEVHDADFAVGRIGNRVGLFPLGFAEVFEGKIEAVKNKSDIQQSKFRWWEKENANNEAVTSVKGASSQPKRPNSMIESAAAKSVPKDAHTGEAIQLPTSVAGFTKAEQLQNINVYGDTSGLHHQSVSYNLENTRSHDTELTSYGRTRFPHVAESYDQLSFVDNEIVTLYCHISADWLDGEIEGKRGLIPADCVEIIVDCPWADESAAGISVGQMPENTADFSSSYSDAMPAVAGKNTMIGRVLVDQPRSVDNDLELWAGDTVTILRQADDYWYEVQRSDGYSGYCMIDHVEIIDESNLLTVSPVDAVVVKNNDKIAENKENKQISSAKSISTSSSVDVTPVASPMTPTKPFIVQSESLAVSAIAPSDSTATVDASVKPPIKQKPAIKPKPKKEGSPISPLMDKEQRKTTFSFESDSSKAGNKSPLDTNKDKETTASNVKTTRDEIPAIPKRTAATTAITPAVSSSKFYDNDVTGSSKPAGQKLSPANSSGISRVAPKPPVEQKPNTNGATSGAKREGQGPTLGLARSKDERSNSMASLDELITREMHSAKGRNSSTASDEINTNTVSLNTLVGTSTFYKQAPPGMTMSASSSPSPLPSSSGVPMSKMMPRQMSMPTGQVPHSQFYNVFSADLDQPASLPPPQPVRVAPPRPTSAPRSQGGAPTAHTSTSAKSNSSKPGVPARPAPAPVRPTNNLIQFSPDKEQPFTDTQKSPCDDEQMMEWKKRITQLEDDLEVCKREYDEAVSSLAVAKTADERRELTSAVEFYKNNVNGLQQEIEQHKCALRETAEREMTEEENERNVRREEQRQQAERERVAREQEQRVKRRENRGNVIAELLSTEADYVSSLDLCLLTFGNLEAAEKNLYVDVDMLCGNMDEVRQLSQRLLRLLEAATKNKSFDEQVIGTCFVQLKDDMKKVYAVYCRNHDDVISLLEKYETHPEAQAYLTQVVDMMRQKKSVFDLGSVLIKPVQRILKYPLLLSELMKSTEDNHPDKVHLHQALDGMTDVAAAINEFKRRKDLVRKYSTMGDTTLSERMSRFNVHSIEKKLSRFSQRVAGPQTVDENYNREERNFRGLELALKATRQNISQYMATFYEALVDSEHVANDMVEFSGEASNQRKDIELFCSAQGRVVSNAWQVFKDRVETAVISPLATLQSYYQTPNKLMKKRNDKLLDYDNWSIRLRTLEGQQASTEAHLTKKVREDVQVAKHDYEALNSQLVEDLPVLYRYSVQLIEHCLHSLLLAQRRFYSATLAQLLNLPLTLTASSDQDIVEAFAVAHAAVTERMSQLTIVPKTFNPAATVAGDGEGTLKRNKSMRSSVPESRTTWMVGALGGGGVGPSVQSESQRAALIKRYPADRLYTVVDNVSAQSTLDLSLAAGTLVALIKDGDPMGNKERWFVDSGDEKGFVNRQQLTLASSVTSRDLISLSPVREDAGKLSLSPDADKLATLKTSPSQLDAKGRQTLAKQSSSEWRALLDDMAAEEISTTTTAYRAMFTFEARSGDEVSVRVGDVVTVLQFGDAEGNSEWWRVRTPAGNVGYLPANFLQAV